jgi:hypothetical protein
MTLAVISIELSSGMPLASSVESVRVTGWSRPDRDRADDRHPELEPVERHPSGLGLDGLAEQEDPTISTPNTIYQ